MPLYRLVRLYIAATIVLIVFLVAGTVVNSVYSSGYSHDQQVAATRAHFWLVVGGQDQGDQPTAADRLAKDLHELPRSQIRSFRGNSNTYGGVSIDLGEDPFTGFCGHECGPLTNEMVAKTRDARSGRASRVIASEVPEAPQHIPTPWWFLGVWLLAGLLIPAWPYIQQWRHESALRHAAPEEARLLEQLTDTVRALPMADPRRAELLLLRNKLESALERRSNIGTSQIDYRINDLLTEARSSLEAYEAGNQAIE